eukprot:12205016-Heterocapsa_arctica.AAC.1
MGFSGSRAIGETFRYRRHIPFDFFCCCNSEPKRSNGSQQHVTTILNGSQQNVNGSHKHVNGSLKSYLEQKWKRLELTRDLDGMFMGKVVEKRIDSDVTVERELDHDKEVSYNGEDELRKRWLGKAELNNPEQDKQ